MNTNDNDGCSSTCTIEPGYKCVQQPQLDNRSYCFGVCGDGKWKASDNEFCDDGNIFSGDGCSDS